MVRTLARWRTLKEDEEEGCPVGSMLSGAMWKVDSHAVVRTDGRVQTFTERLSL